MNTKINLKKIVAISLLIIATSFSLTVFAQKEVIYSSDWGEKLPSFPNHLILKSNVDFVHEDMKMTCD